ncbi:DUF6898 family protein [Hyphobacterium sp.]|uniref:DUF6898 family protein n=1 Tax=Hyphobacterium sp. TaxID=2004662 RepID=UPI003B5171C3
MLAGREIIFEFIDTGPAIRVAAIDVATGEEVVIQSPKSAARADMEKVAAAKLARKLGLTGKKKRPDEKSPGRGIKI